MLPTDIERMYDRTAKIEAGYVDNPNDRGGATNFGLSLRYAKAVGDRNGDGKQDFDLDGNGAVDKEDIKLLTKSRVRDEFMAEFYYRPGFDKLPDSIQPFIFDAAVHSGPGQSIKYLQAVINQAGFGPIQEDGGLGPTTYRKADLAFAQMGPFLVNALVCERLAHFDRICEANPSQLVMLRGWKIRAKSFEVPV